MTNRICTTWAWQGALFMQPLPETFVQGINKDCLGIGVIIEKEYKEI